MSADAIAADAATTNWRSYDGPVPAKFIFYVVLFPLLMASFLVIPGFICYLALSVGRRGRISPYSPPNSMRGNLDRRGVHHAPTAHGSMMEK